MSDDFVEEFDTDDESAPTKGEPDSVLTSSENTNNENREKELNSSQPSATSSNPTDSNNEEYMANTTYTADGIAIYTDPDSKFQYQWCKKENKWIPYQSENSNPYENEYYFWCTEKNEWQLKANYDYDEEQKKWIPKEKGEMFGQYHVIEKDGVKTYTDSDGVAYEWDEEKKAWFPKIDEDFMAIYQMNYGNYVPSEEDKEKERKKRALAEEMKKKQPEESDEPVNKKMKKKPDAPKWFEIAPQHNTKVYVENLPLDITEEEFSDLMSKYGMIFKDPTTNKFRVKLYRTSDGHLKGDGLCTYIKVS